MSKIEEEFDGWINDLKKEEISMYDTRMSYIDKTVQNLLLNSMDHTMRGELLQILRAQIQQTLTVYEYSIINNKFDFIALPHLKQNIYDKLQYAISNLKNMAAVVEEKIKKDALLVLDGKLSDLKINNKDFDKLKGDFKKKLSSSLLLRTKKEVVEEEIKNIHKKMLNKKIFLAIGNQNRTSFDFPSYSNKAYSRLNSGFDDSISNIIEEAQTEYRVQFHNEMPISSRGALLQNLSLGVSLHMYEQYLKGIDVVANEKKETELPEYATLQDLFINEYKLKMQQCVDILKESPINALNANNRIIRNVNILVVWYRALQQQGFVANTTDLIAHKLLTEYFDIKFNRSILSKAGKTANEHFEHIENALKSIKNSK
jgi:hypothetical protein